MNAGFQPGMNDRRHPAGTICIDYFPMLLYQIVQNITGEREMSKSTQSVIRELEQEAATTRKLLAIVPNEKLEWAPHTKSMPLGQLAMHIASIPGNVS